MNCKKLYLYLIERPDEVGWDEFDEAVVCAKSPQAARKIHPGYDCGYEGRNSWCSPEEVKVKCVGMAKRGMKEGTVVCASFHAG